MLAGTLSNFSFELFPVHDKMYFEGSFATTGMVAPPSQPKRAPLKQHGLEVEPSPLLPALNTSHLGHRLGL
jgi:hypothetical protein